MIVRAYTQQSIFQNYIPENLQELDEELSKIDKLLDREEIIDIIESAFVAKRKNAKRVGRKGYSLEFRIRLLLLKHMYKWSYQETIREIRGSITYREFTRLYDRKAPHVRRLKEWAQVITPEVVKKIHETIVKIAREKKVSRGRKLRTDTTAVESNMHYPTDSSLMNDAVRKVCKTIEKIREVGKKVGFEPGKAGRNFQRTVKRRLLRIIKFARGRKEEVKKRFMEEYKHLLVIAKQVAKNAGTVKRKVGQGMRKAKQQGSDILDQIALIGLKKDLSHWQEMLKKVIRQTEERVLNGNTHFKDKIVSIFEPHSLGIKKGKAGKPIEFGRKVEITESENKIISDYRILDGAPYDGDILPEIIDRHKDRFGKPPDLVAGDRGNWKPGIEEEIRSKGVRRVSIPQKGRRSKEREKYEKQRWFKKAQRFRAGSEGTISKLKRGRGMDRCLYKGEAGMGRWVGLGVICSNLKVIATRV